MKQLVVMGGGGFTMEPDNPLLNQFVLGLTDKEQPKVCFLGQASAESQEYTVQFYRAFLDLGAVPSHFSVFGSVAPGWQGRLLAQDVIYVGGGNTRSMLALWREWGVDTVLAQALENGTILAGLSAGMICWFEQGITDSVQPLGVLPCLGFLPGSACPHYDGEAERRPAYLQMVKEGRALPGLALDDSAAAHFVDGALREIVTSKPGARAFQVLREDGEAVEEPLPTRYLGA